MEQARYWNMWAKRKPDLNNLKPAAAATANSYGDSWEEQAFAEDAAGILGGCVWPPRSYSCSFCRREFRSAQALGGHMNVHRRDRARLKQSSIPPSHQQDSVLAPQIHALNTCTSFDPTDNPFPPQISTILYNNPNPDKESDPVVRSHLVRVSSPPGTNKEEKKTSSTLSFFSPHQQNNKINRMDVPLSPSPSWSSFVSGKRNRPDLMDSTKNEEKETDKVVVAVEKVENCVTEDRLSMNLNLDVICRKEEEIASCKRRRIESSPFIFFPDHRCLIPQVDVLKLRPGSGEELDLELRLGDGPKTNLSDQVGGRIERNAHGATDVFF